MSARQRILARIRERQGKPPQPGADEREAVHLHIAAHPRSPAPRADADPITRFRERALALAATCDTIPEPAALPAALARYLRQHALLPRAVCWPELEHLDWTAAGIEVEARSAHAGDLVGITGAFCAIAETGTLVILSGAHAPPTVSLLPETHIAVLERGRVVDSMEDAWALLRRAGALPRSVTFISGPSRTADIEQTVTLGAHGPYRVHVVLLGA